MTFRVKGFSRFGFFLALVVLVGGLTHHYLRDETRIKRVIHRGCRAITRKNLVSLGLLLSYDFEGPQGIGREIVLGLARDMFQNTEDLRLTAESIEILRRDSDSALLRVQVLARGSPQLSTGHGFSMDSQRGRFEVEVTRKPAGWKVSRIMPIKEPILP